MSSAYFFALAAILAVVPILLIFKINIEKIKENPQEIGKIQTRFFIGVAIAEAIPIILIVFGLMDLTPVASIEELYIPGLMVILAMVFGPIFILLQRAVGVPEEARQAVNTFSFIGLAMSNAIPLVALVCLFLIMP